MVPHFVFFTRPLILRRAVPTLASYSNELLFYTRVLCFYRF